MTPQQARDVIACIDANTSLGLDAVQKISMITAEAVAQHAFKRGDYAWSQVLRVDPFRDTFRIPTGFWGKTIHVRIEEIVPR